MSVTEHDRLMTAGDDLWADVPRHGFLRKTWYWLKFWLYVKTARLRFLAILALIGMTIAYWDTLRAHYEKWTRPPQVQTEVAAPENEYFCPMHPQILRDNPKDKCPLCFMPLSKRKKSSGADEPLPAGIASRVQLAPYRVVLAGVRTS